ncbi:Protein of unknown function [Cotesia congregata]|uniref:Uncharacterized protein n=1 Tax=Cotesia congregata TaxID=51543 RepID=A0A8J2HIV0_COTCN|nr:Protein of unknown function [Cotesia congregata]
MLYTVALKTLLRCCGTRVRVEMSSGRSRRGGGGGRRPGPRRDPAVLVENQLADTPGRCPRVQRDPQSQDTPGMNYLRNYRYCKVFQIVLPVQWSLRRCATNSHRSSFVES